MDNIYKNIEEDNPNKKRKILIIFDNMIDTLGLNLDKIGLACFIIYLYVCMLKLFYFLWKILHGVKVLYARAYLEYLLLTRFELMFL